MPRTFIFLLIGLFFGTGFGFLLAASSGTKLEGHDHGADTAAHDHAAHQHDGGDTHHHDALTEAADPAPTLALKIHPDGPQSRNLELVTGNFTFDPEGVNGPHVPGHGHAHVYLNGVKLARAYGRWQQLYALPKGRHRLRVTLNANDHSQLAVDGEPITAEMELVIE
ncbi:hypothetical protein BXY70_3423 [Roseovarius halotolerans]|uniref:DUF4399 domain-containing protein n=1 Tax=Roseovarius halotolerans TaxID=505353 RepID=A0A1X6ZPI9_9RHOB|nr:hypothetical protein [Roseovarius halotolerans]RKT28065.1 hypothetical protein BXY70_3423 [Roseovarius halotolerans]SLN57727.1 hypothetical protein ROH8110_03177 [Roseovarius halotolerans]